MDIDFEKFTWLIEIIAGIFVLLLVIFLFNYFTRKKDWGKAEAFVKKIRTVIRSPFMLIVWTAGFYFISYVIIHHFDLDRILAYIRPVKNTLLAIGFTWMALKANQEFQKVLKRGVQKKKLSLDRPSIELLGKLTAILIFFIAVIYVLHILGLDIRPLLAFGGIGAAAIGFAAKDAIANFFGGFMLHLTKAFTVDDFVQLPEKKLMGVIESIGWYNTVLRDLEKCPIYIPNSLFFTTFLKNSTRRTHRRIELNFGVRYEDISKIKGVDDEIKSLLKKENFLDINLPIIVNFREFKEYYLQMYVSFYILNTDYENFMGIKEHVLLLINSVLEKYDVEIPYPVSTVEVKKLDE